MAYPLRRSGGARSVVNCGSNGFSGALLSMSANLMHSTSLKAEGAEHGEPAKRSRIDSPRTCDWLGGSSRRVPTRPEEADRMNSKRLAQLTDHQRLEYAEEHWWLPCESLNAWRLCVSEWWCICRMEQRLHVRGVTRAGKVYVAAHTVIVGRWYGEPDRPYGVMSRLRALRLPGEIAFTSMERIDLERVPIRAVPDVIAALEELATRRHP